jgi:cytochrome c553
MAASLLFLLPAAAAAQPKPELLSACAACHGPGGNSQVAQFPSLAGQPKVFVENQLVLIREGLRDVPSMKEVVTGMSDETIVALAKYYAAQTPAANAAPVRQDKYRPGEQVSKKMLCGTCHLPDYSGQTQVPRLAGQHEEYLLAAMKQFRDNPGPGRDTIMAASLRGLSDADLANLAHYLAAFRP